MTEAGFSPSTAVVPVLLERLEQVHRRVELRDGGKVADYIPELAKVDPASFGIALATSDGHVYSVGDAEQPFTIQSISKPFVYGMVLDALGPAEVTARIGVEPSGDAFNSIVMDERRNRPLNPMVNAGAIACSSLVPGQGLEDRLARLVGVFERYVGHPLEVDEEVWQSERATGHRNRAIAYLELSSGMIAEPVAEHLDLYFAQCSVLVTAADLAMMAATLANGGVNPRTGERAVSAESVRLLLTVMATCGMYDWSGEWLYRVGVPAKSGVGGGILAVLPGQLGVGTFSPRLDDWGNSTRGVQVCEELVSEFSLHMLEVTSAAGSVVRRRYDASAVPSKRLRRHDERAILQEEGEAIEVFELQGELFFATAEQLVRQVEGRSAGVDYVIIDARRTESANAAAISLLLQLRGAVEAQGARLVYAGCDEGLRKALVGDDPDGAEVFWPDVDDALEHCENLLLARRIGTAGDDDVAEIDLGELDILRDLAAEELALLEPLLTIAHYPAGATIVREGEVADRLCFIVAGRATACLSFDEGRTVRRLRSFGAGVAFGETALFAGGRRTADVVADVAVTCRELRVEDLHALAVTHPALYSRVLVAAGGSLCRLLGRATEQIRALNA